MKDPDDNTKWPKLEPPAKHYSSRTVILTVLSIISFGAALFAVVKPLHWSIGSTLGVASVGLFIVAKRFEKRDRKKHGADYDSWLNNVGPGGFPR